MNEIMRQQMTQSARKAHSDLMQYPVRISSSVTMTSMDVCDEEILPVLNEALKALLILKTILEEQTLRENNKKF